MEKKAALVIGAGDALGSAIARRFAREGFIACVARRNGEKLAPVVEAIRGDGGTAVPFGVDARKEEAMVQEYFSLFLERIEESRGTEPRKLRKLATGEVFTARRAREMGLVDELGDLDAAIDLAAKLAKTRRRVAHVRPHRTAVGRAGRRAPARAQLV